MSRGQRVPKDELPHRVNAWHRARRSPRENDSDTVIKHIYGNISAIVTVPQQRVAFAVVPSGCKIVYEGI
jgi:hypothetical protein